MNERLEQLADILFGKVMGWERNALWRIGMRLKKIKSLSYADLQAINNAAVVNKDIKAILDELADLTAQNIVDVIQIYSEMLDKQHEENKELYEYRKKTYVPFYENKQLQAIVAAYAKTTAETMINLSMTKAQQLGTIDANGNFIPIEKSFTDILDKAVMSVATGTGDVNSEMRGVLKELGGSGIRVNYGNGVTRRLGTMVRQNLLYGAKQASVAYSEMIGEELKCDGIEIDWHSFPRPSHEFMQGKQYSLNGKRAVNGITYEGADKALTALDDYGCLHFKTPIILGVSEPRYSSEELKRLNKENTRPITINGVTKSGYEWKQTLRRLETESRNTKEQYELLKTSGDNIGAQQLRYKLGAIENKYNAISNATGIKAQPQRMSFVKGKALTKIEKSSIIKADKVFYTKEDPMREVFGAGIESHPEEIEKILRMCSEKGVEVIHRKGTMSYQPNPISGKPGQLVIDEESSYSAWKHEERHILDDEKTQWAGFRNFLDIDKAIKFEVDAYDVEIGIAEQYGMDDMVERLEKLKEKRRRELLGE